MGAYDNRDDLRYGLLLDAEPREPVPSPLVRFRDLPGPAACTVLCVAFLELLRVVL